jgi:hypothetical protein
MSGTTSQSAPLTEKAALADLVTWVETTPKSQHDACLLMLGWLRDSRYLSTLEYFREAEKLLVNTSSEPRRYHEKPDKDCLE